MVGLDLEAQCQSKEYGSKQSLASVGIDQGCENPGHESDGHHLGIVPDLDNLHIVGAECDGYRTDCRKPGIDPEGQEQQEAAEQRDYQITGRTLSPEEQIVERVGRIPSVVHRYLGGRHTAEHRAGPQSGVIRMLLIPLQYLVRHSLP